MIKIGIITFHDAINYGAALQAYALQTFLCDNGYDARIIDLAEQKGVNVGYRQRIGEALNRILYMLHKVDLDSLHNNFLTFMNTNMKLTPHYNNPKELKDSPPVCDLLICGSDQIWNCSSELRDIYFLDFGQARKISYAASIGVETIPEVTKKRFKELVEKLDDVSVREDSAKSLIESFSDINCRVDVDPTFLLSKEKWCSLIKEPIIKEHYILYYPLHSSKNAQQHLLKLKDQMKLKIVTITTSARPTFGDIIIRNAGPLEFLNLYRYASYTINASFHGTVFSLIFEKPFNSQVYNQSGSRVLSLLKKVGLEKRIFDDVSSPEDDSITLDYNDVNRKLEVMANESRQYLIENADGRTI